MLSSVTGRWERKLVISLSLGVFVLGNLLIALSANYPMAMAGRVVSALGGSLQDVVSHGRMPDAGCRMPDTGCYTRVVVPRTISS